MCFGPKTKISVLLVFKLILFVLSHCARGPKSGFIKEFTFLAIYLSIVGWYHLQNDVLYLMLLTNLNHW